MLLDLLLGLGMVVGPVLAFLPQYLQIQSSGSSEGFSPLICFILLTANILKVFFWLQKRFEITLLLQSVFMIIAQLALIRLQGRPEKPFRFNYRLQRGFAMQNFWNWDYFGEYISFLGLLAGSVGLVTTLNLVVLHSSVITELMGSLALMTESTLGMPQLLQNYRAHSASGLSVEMMLAWLLGDAFKAFYFYRIGAPYQFIVCGLVQLTVDVLLGLQILTYPRRIGAPARILPFSHDSSSSTSVLSSEGNSNNKPSPFM